MRICAAVQDQVGAGNREGSLVGLRHVMDPGIVFAGAGGLPRERAAGATGAMAEGEGRTGGDACGSAGQTRAGADDGCAVASLYTCRARDVRRRRVEIFMVLQDQGCRSQGSRASVSWRGLGLGSLQTEEG